MKKNNSRFYGLCIVIIICFLSMTPFFVSCGSSGGGDNSDQTDAPCSPENCTEDQWDDIFVQAITELHTEDLVINIYTINTDLNVYLAIIDRMMSIVGEDGSEQQTQLAGFLNYDNKIEYCGPGSYKPDPKDERAGECLNRVCFDHDNCYGTIKEADNTLCAWTDSTEHCDKEFFLGYDKCVNSNECGGRCKALATGARNTRADVPCKWANNMFGGDPTGNCQWRADNCNNCTSKDPKDSCAALGANCGETSDGCVYKINCGSCPDPSTQECGIYMGRDNQCRPINPDADGDGYNTTDKGGDDCDDRPLGKDNIPGNADDGALINPGQWETFDDGIDQDCSGSDHVTPTGSICLVSVKGPYSTDPERIFDLYNFDPELPKPWGYIKEAGCSYELRDPGPYESGYRHLYLDYSFKTFINDYVYANMDGCGKTGEYIMVDEGQNIAVAYSTKRRLRASLRYPDHFSNAEDVLAELLEKAVNQGVGDVCP